MAFLNARASFWAEIGVTGAGSPELVAFGSKALATDAQPSVGTGSGMGPNWRPVEVFVDVEQVLMGQIRVNS